MSTDIDNSSSAKRAFELHFQEIFTGERIDIIASDKVRAQVVAKTRFQTGLAHIETLELCNGEKVVFQIVELNLQATIKVDVTKPFVSVKIINGQLQVDGTDIRPGYL
jgi:hypothetical protein